MSTKHLKTLQTIVNLPTAPFAEASVAAFIRGFVARHRELRVRGDRFGNLLVKYLPRRKSGKGRVGRPILFAAHMDHPGFVAQRMVGAGRVYADWRGWVQGRYFKGERVIFRVGSRWVEGTIEKCMPHEPGKMPKRAVASGRPFGATAPPKGVIARVGRDVPEGSVGMWGLPDAKIRGHRLACRASDDLSGLAGIVCALEEMCRQGTRCPCYALFTRAEEVGFGGALAAADGGTLPKGVIVVAVENSKAIAGVSLGDGPVLRVGDKASVFTPAATAYCQVAAEKLAEADATFKFQRKLMDGGTCESTAYCHYGHDATGICLPLLNYHNMDTEREKIGPEIIDTRDFLNLVKWFVSLAESPMRIRFEEGHPGLGKRLDALLKQHRRRLMRTAATC